MTRIAGRWLPPPTLLLGAMALLTPRIALADPPDAPTAEVPAAPPTAPAPAPVTAPAPAPVTAPAPVAAPVAAPAPAPVAAPEPAKPAVMRRVPRILGLAVGWGWNTVNKLPVSLTGAKTQPHGLSIFSDFLWQVGGIGEGWPSWIGFMAGFLYFPKSAVRRNAYALEYGVLVRHGLFPGFILRPFLAYGLGATQAWVTGVESRGIGHLTRLSLGTDIVLSSRVSLSVELGYKIINVPTFATSPGMVPGPYDFHTLTALFGGHVGI